VPGLLPGLRNLRCGAWQAAPERMPIMITVALIIFASAVALLFIDKYEVL
jgi:hypothetical protein